MPSDSCCIATHLTERYGASFLPEDMTIQDWGVTYDDLEPHYDPVRIFVRDVGTGPETSRARSWRSGNPLRGAALPALSQPATTTAVRTNPVPQRRRANSATSRFRQPSGNMSRPYQNPLGVRLGPLRLLRDLTEWFGCGNYSKATPQTTILPALLRKPDFSARDNSEVTRIDCRCLRQRRATERHVRCLTKATRPTGTTRRSSHPVRLYDLQPVHGCCCCRTSEEPYDPSRQIPASSAANFTHQTISDVPSFFESRKIHLQSVHRLRRDRSVHRRIQRR